MQILHPITRWERYDPVHCRWVYSHCENGHAEGEKPTPTLPVHRNWPHYQWRKTHEKAEGPVTESESEARLRKSWEKHVGKEGT
jgi:hypothetical protein